MLYISNKDSTIIRQSIAYQLQTRQNALHIQSPKRDTCRIWNLGWQM